jgi:outer membrane immunogenic protein
MKRLLFGTTALIVVSATSAASAADLPVRYKAPVAAPVAFSWTGCYIGANVGGGWGPKVWTDPALGGTEFSRHDLSGAIAGGQAGCDYQTGIWVFGIEADAAWADLRGDGPDFLSNGTLQDNSRVNAVGSVTGRVGATFERALFYVKGGAAWARDKFFVSDFTGATLATADQTRWGFVVGGGWEWAFAQNWSVKAEYEYMDFGKQSATFSGPGTAPFSFDIDQKIHLLKLGVNYRFGWDAPLVARY